MKIGIIADIHANARALNAVLVFLKRNQCTKCFCLGDMVGYYDGANEVLDTMREEEILCIKGNHEKYLLEELPYNETLEHLYGIKKQREMISSQNLAFLRSLNDGMHVTVEGQRMGLFHGLPGKSEVYCYRMEDYLSAVDHMEEPGYYLNAHTHIPFEGKLQDTVLINPGSVGQPRDYDPRPSCAILDIPLREARFFRIDYPVNEYVQHLKREGYPPELTAILLRKTKGEHV